MIMIIGIVIVKNAVSVGDAWHRLVYDPPAQVEQLAGNAGLNENGINLLYRFAPQVVPDETLQQQCGESRLGCIVGRNIYIRQWSGQAGQNQAVVTAAHEMLHVPYSRYTEDQKASLKGFIDEQLGLSISRSVAAKLEGYPPEDYYNEAHSFLATEVSQLIPELEDHYAQYFSDRAKVIAAFGASPNE
jgi:hypothetical protein